MLFSLTTKPQHLPNSVINDPPNNYKSVENSWIVPKKETFPIAEHIPPFDYSTNVEDISSH
jgi:hypothetical protein